MEALLTLEDRANPTAEMGGSESKHAAVKFIETMFDAEDRLAFMVKDKGQKPQHLFVTAAEACTKEFIHLLVERNEAGADVYLAPNVFQGNRRKKENVSKINALWIDIDHGGRGVLDKLFESKTIPEPTVVLETSPDKFHCLWKVESGISVDEAEGTLKSLAKDFGGDSNSTDAPRVLRVPGFRNCKYPEAPEVEVVHESTSISRLSRTAFSVRNSDHQIQPKQVLVPNEAVDLSAVAADIKAIFAEGKPILAGPEGGRNSGLASVAGKFRNLGLDAEQIEEQLHKYNEQFCEPPFSSADELAEIRTIAQSIGGRNVHDKNAVTLTIGGQKVGDSPTAAIQSPAPTQQDVDDPYEVLVVPPSQEYLELLRRSRLAKQTDSWLAEHAECPHAMQASEDDWLVDRLIRRRGLAIFAAEQGSFKSLLALFMAKAFVDANKTPLGVSEFLGRQVRTKFDDEDKRPFRIYYIDLDSPKGLTKKNCLHVGLDDKSNINGTFKVLGAYSDDPITTMDDPRLVEAAKRERAFFIFDTLSKVFEGNDENNPTDANAIMSKGSRLAYASEGVLILHHDAKGGKFGYRGSTPIVAVPDMSFNLSREKGQNIAILEQIRFKDVEDYSIKVELSFGSNENLVIDSHYKYQTLLDSLSVDGCKVANAERQQAALHRSAKDQETILKAKELIEAAAASKNPGLSQSSLAKQLGIKGPKAKDRILCASTNDDPRPWLMERNDKGWLVFMPLPPEEALPF